MSGNSRYMLVQYVTVARIPLAISVAVLLQFAAAKEPLAFVVIGLLVVQELTDMFDGWLARRLGASSRFGSLFDPYCDSIARLITFFGLAAAGMCDSWLFLLLAVRDVSVAYIRFMCILKGLQVAARVSGKLKALAQGIGAIVLVVLFSFGGPVGVKKPWLAEGVEHAPLVIEILIAVVTFWSLLDYFKAARHKPVGEPLTK